jgi:hypothetical protein
MAPKVKAANANAATVKTTINNFEALAVTMRYFTIVIKYILRLNKRYFITFIKYTCSSQIQIKWRKNKFNETKELVKAPSMYNATTTTLNTKNAERCEPIPIF